MNLQSIVVVVLRLLALDFLLRVAVEGTPQFLQLLSIWHTYQNQGSPTDDLPHFIVLAWLVIIGLIVGAILLWVLAWPIARLVTRGVTHDLSFGATSPADCYSMAFMTVGLFYIAGKFPQVLNMTYYMFKATASTTNEPREANIGGYQAAQVFIPFIIGVVLFVNGRKWGVALARRHASVPPASTEVNDNNDTTA